MLARAFSLTHIQQMEAVITVRLLLILFTIYWRAQAQTTPVIDVVVAKDGTGHYTTISEAIIAAPDRSPRRYSIKIKAGNYTENVIVPNDKTNLAFIGEGPDKTIISGHKSSGKDHIRTYETATVGIEGAGFLAIGITFENTAGPSGQQAVALRSNVQSAFYRCKFVGYQDTLNTNEATQFYRDCDIYGTVDFIFGMAAVVLQNCNIYPRLPNIGQYNTITAQGQYKAGSNEGIVIQNCTITAAEDLRLHTTSVKSYLGRPWKEFSTTIVMQSFIDDVIDPKGWIEWEGNKTSLDSIYYAEYQNRGPGASSKDRVRWTTLRMINRTEATRFTVKNFLHGGTWIPSEVPFYLDLI